MGPATGRLRFQLRFQPSRPAPSLPHQVPNEHAENAGTRKRRHQEERPALDPLENSIRKERTFPSAWRAPGVMGAGHDRLTTANVARRDRSSHRFDTWVRIAHYWRQFQATRRGCHVALVMGFPWV